MAPLEGGLPDFHELIGPIGDGPVQEAQLQPVPQEIQLVRPTLGEGPVHVQVIQVQPNIDHSLGLLPQQIVTHYSDISADPMQLQLLANATY